MTSHVALRIAWAVAVLAVLIPVKAARLVAEVLAYGLSEIEQAVERVAGV